MHGRASERLFCSVRSTKNLTVNVIVVKYLKVTINHRFRITIICVKLGLLMVFQTLNNHKKNVV